MLQALQQWYRNWMRGDSRVRESDPELERLFEGRSELSDREFYKQYFESSGTPFEIVAEVRQAFIKHVPLDMRRLEPEDNFGKELQFVWSYDSLADVELICEIENRFGISITEEEGQSTLTMRDLILLVAAKVKNPFNSAAESSANPQI